MYECSQVLPILFNRIISCHARLFGILLNADMLNAITQVFLQPTEKTSYLRHVKFLIKYSNEVQQQFLDIISFWYVHRTQNKSRTSGSVTYQARLHCNEHSRSTTQNRTEETKEYKDDKYGKRWRVSTSQRN
jgi:hypothetical protein